MNTQALDKLLAIEKPSDFFALALDDLEAIAKTSGYVIDMHVWINNSPKDNACHVCLAGAVMSRSLQITTSEFLEDDNFWDDNKQVSDLADAMDYFRSGRLDNACQSFFEAKDAYTPVFPDINNDYSITSYEDDKKEFMVDSRAAIEYLQSLGL